MTASENRTAAGSILYDGSRVSQPEDALFTRDYWAARNALREVAGGRGQVLHIGDGKRRWVARHYRRGGLVARVLTDTFLWLGSERTRSFREWRLLDRLHREGFPVPAPVAARYVRSGLVYRADLIMEELPQTRTLADSITGSDLPGPVWTAIGETVARLHRRGVHHADLNAHNILLGPGGEVSVIDFDRGRLRARGGWEARVIARLQRSLEKTSKQRQDVRFGTAQWAALLAGYEADLSSF